MIFKQVDEILSGQKTQTRRVVKPGEEPNRWFTDGPDDDRICEVVHQTNRMAIRTKWAIGHTYAVVPKRGQPGMIWIENWADGTTTPDGTFSAMSCHKENRKYFTENGWRPLRIRITAIRQERLQAITEADAKAEGVADVEAYRALWQAINGKTPGARWDANPTVFVLEFELVRETQS